MLNQYLDEVEGNYTKKQIKKLKNNNEFFFLVQMFVDNQLIDVETIMSMFLEKPFEECYEQLTKFCQDEPEFVFDDVDQTLLDLQMQFEQEDVA
jgi:hypothetical protein